MSSHGKAKSGSRSLCLELQKDLQKTIPDLRVSESKQTCGLYEPGRNRFAYVYHRTDQDLIRVYFRGDSSVKLIDPTGHIDIQVRPKIESGWEKEFPYFFVISKSTEVDLATKILLIYSYPLSVKKSRQKESLKEYTVLIPEEIPDTTGLMEGTTRRIRVNVYERNQTARTLCIEHYGAKCFICGFNFEFVYGELGKGYIHVHHIKPLAEIKSGYQVNPIEDLRPVCPNCHAMIHRASPPATCKEIRKLIEENALKRNSHD
ncbi:MAG: HNH endonuclease [Anaerolineae bacterium]|nr:HNH endonuclease [Anaerolineae bacterium]MCB9103295.1 HNH endonuclease [Anaerolineales bacterium]